MRELLATGLSAAEAARQAAAEPRAPDGVVRPDVAAASAELRRALEQLDDAGAHAAFDRLLADYSTRAVLADVVLPLLHELGAGWERGEISVAQEHFASNLLRGRLLGLARGWDRGTGPRAVLACPPGERHDLGLVIFGLALRELGWRITFLGADTPPDTIVDTVRRLEPEALVLAVTDSARLGGVAETAGPPQRHAHGGLDRWRRRRRGRRRARPGRVAARGGGAGRGLVGGFGEIAAEPPGRAARPEAASSVAPIAAAIDAPCVLASERASHAGDERRSAKPS